MTRTDRLIQAKNEVRKKYCGEPWYRGIITHEGIIYLKVEDFCAVRQLLPYTYKDYSLFVTDSSDHILD